MSYTQEEGYVEGFTNVRIFFRKFTTENATRTIIIVHGLGEHSGRYMNVVNHFAGTGTNFYLIDNRGHGRSEGQRGHILLFGQYLDDLRIFVEKVRESESSHDLFLLGHSMGGNMVANYLIQRDSFFTGAILAAPGFKIAAKINPIKAALGKLLSQIIPTLSMPSELNPQHLSHDPAVLKDYAKDALVHTKVSTRWFTQFLWAGDFALKNAKYIRCPVLLLQGGDDPIIAPAGAQEFFNNLTVEKKTLHIFKGFLHEVFNEVEKQKPLSILENWVKERCLDKSATNLVVGPRAGAK